MEWDGRHRTDEISYGPVASSVATPPVCLSTRVRIYIADGGMRAESDRGLSDPHGHQVLAIPPP